MRETTTENLDYKLKKAVKEFYRAVQQYVILDTDVINRRPHQNTDEFKTSDSDIAYS